MFYKDTRTENEKYLEEELERERYERNQENERQDRAREERRREQREQSEYEWRHPDNWESAFQAQAGLCWREHNQYPDETDMFFKNSAEANEKALEIWRVVSASKQMELDELQKQIDAVWDRVRNETADKLIASDSRQEFVSTAEALRDNALDGYCDW